MNTTTTPFAWPVFAALSFGATVAHADPAPAPAFKAEKCFGIVAGKNDCQTAASSCAGTSKKDAQADARAHVPAGTCAKIAGGTMAKG